MRVIAFVLLFVALLPISAETRTWYIKADGTGDAPTIQAGVDSAVAGDLVLVGPGTHEPGYIGIRVKPGVNLISEAGPAATIIQAPPYNYTPPCIIVGSGNNEISGFWIKGPTTYCGIGPGPNSTVSYNIVEAFHTSRGISVDEHCTIHNNLIYGVPTPEGGTGISYTSPEALGSTVYNNIIFCSEVCGNGEYVINSWGNIVLAPACVTGYFQADPQFCGAWGEENFFLQSDSPCAPGNPENQWCGQIGPLPVGCGAVPVESRSWGAIKHMYKE